MIKPFKDPILVTESTLPSYEGYTKTLKKIWNTCWLTNQGPLHNELIEKLKKQLGVKEITLFVNGHLALDTAVKSLEFKKNGEIITTPFTFVSTTHAISMNGYKPIFCDIKMTDYTIDESKIEKLINKNTVAIVATHVYGYPCNVKKIAAIAKKHNLKVIYDAAHAFGVEVNNKPIGNFGDISMFSFHATKVFNTIEGGALVYKDRHLRSFFDLTKNFGILNAEEIVSLGYNAKMNEFQAAMGLENLKNLDKSIAKRKKATMVYYKHLSKIPGIKLADFDPKVEYNYAYMPILVDEKEFPIDRNKLYDELLKYNVYTRKYFFPLISNIKPYEKNPGKVPIANYVSERILCLPLSSSLTPEDVKKICDIINEIKTNHEKK